LVGREDELAAIRGTLDRARAGASATLLLEGAAGIGKTSLLDHAVAAAEGFNVLTARGVEFEAEFAFAGLHELLRPILPLIDRLPPLQAEALAGALQIAPVEHLDTYSVSVALLSLLAAAAEEQPVLQIVDDAHWLDNASAAALAFAVRRLDADAVATFVAMRDGHDSPLVAASQQRMRVTGLARPEARDLLERMAGTTVSATVADELREATAGNPLALSELGQGLSAGELAGRTPLPEQLAAGAAIEAAFARRVGTLSAGAEEALLVAAASDAGRMDTILCAAAASGLGEAAFLEAESAGLIAVDRGTLRFEHPLLRSFIYGRASAARRRAAHLALAGCAPEDQPERRAWHRAAAALAPDEGVAAELESAAHAFSRRSGHVAAARALERAASLTPGDDARARRLLAAAESAWNAGSPAWAAELLAEALPLVRDPLLRADIEFRQTTIEAWAGAPHAARERYVTLAARLAAEDVDRAAAALSYAAAMLVVGGSVAEAHTVAARAAELAATGTVSSRTNRIVDETFGVILLMQGETEHGRERVVRAARWFEDAEDLGGSQYAALALAWVERYDDARRLLEPLIARSRQQGNLRALAAGLEVLAEVEFRTGEWQRAYAAASESVRLAQETDQPVQLAYSAGVLAIVEAAQGREEAPTHAALARELGAERGLDMMAEYAGYALGLFELGRGSIGAALAQLETAAAFARRSGRGEPGVLQWGPDLVEAYLRDGRVDMAAQALDELESMARATNRKWALAASARCRALLAEEGAAAESAYGEAASLHTTLSAPFERARNELGFGAWLRRSRRRREARDVLRSALATFERLGARPWAQAAHRELEATGEVVARDGGPAGGVLASQELQVAVVVAKGATNREAASALFLSPKTIESHLSSAYRKLGVRSRTQLAAALAASSP